MWTRAELKANAKQILRRTYWSGFLVMLLVDILTAAQGMPSLILQLEENFGLVFSVRTVSFVGFFALAYSVFLGNPIAVGKNYYFLHSREHDPEISCVFSRFGDGNYLNVVCTMFLRSIKVFLWSLLLVVPGIIKAYEYYFVPYLLAENPRLSPAKAFELSRYMTDGVKFQIFFLELSFLGWYLLGSLAFGVGILFVGPYFEATIAELYMAQRAKVL